MRPTVRDAVGIACVRVPDNWNGTLISDLDYHTSADSPRNLALLEHGYALSGTGRRANRLTQYDLDDCHVVESRPIDEPLTFLLDHLPPQMHLVITTREDPQLPLARLRTRDQLTEPRAIDLRFTSDEAIEFLHRVMGLNLGAQEIAALESRTEGWIAGLQLSALALQGVSMPGHQGAAGFIDSFSGGHHFVMDYLVEEVLQQQSKAVQDFLLLQMTIKW